MVKSSQDLSDTLRILTRKAREAGLNDTAWAARAGVRKETLCRVRSRQTCDFGTLLSLANAAGAQLGVMDVPRTRSTSDGHFPAKLDRAYEDRLAKLCASGTLDRAIWEASGPRFFMAGLAVMVASVPQRDRQGLLALSEDLHPGSSEPAVFARWLERSPLRPSRFFPLMEAAAAYAA